MKTYVIVGNINGEKGILSNYETVDFWQSENEPFTVRYSTTANLSEDTTTLPTIALLFDSYAVGEYPCFEDVSTTPYNSRGRYTNDWLSVQTKLVRNKNANAVIFTLN